MKRPNILILYTDQQRWDAVGANGNEDILTPNLDLLAASGVNFNHYFVQNPVCMPSRASFLTGKYPSSLGITHMGVPVPESAVTLPRLLKGGGYVCGNIGKLHFLPHANRDHRNPHPSYGFDHLEISDEPGCYEDAYRAWVRRKAPEQLDAISLGLPPAAETWQAAMGLHDGIVHPQERFPKRALPFGGADDVTQAAFVAEQTLDFIDQHRQQSWLCVAGFYSPHSPWVAPQRYLDLYDPDKLAIPTFPAETEERRKQLPDYSDQVLRSARHGYYAMISEVDDQVGRILRGLDEFGLADDTIVIFTSDHGEWLGEHLRYGKSYPGCDCVSRVPFIVRWPAGIREPGRVVSDIVEAVDMVPTVLDCCAMQLPQFLQGQSLLPQLENRAGAGRGSALMEHTGWKHVRTDRYRYIVKANGSESLYDLREDPGEYKDVAADPAYAGALSDMRKELTLRLLQAERPMERSWSY